VFHQIFESGSAATSLTHTAPFRQHNWDQFVSSVPACADLAGTDHTVDCLLEANSTDILEGLNSSREKAVEGFPWDPTLDGPGGIYPDYPSVMFKLGQFARIPFISGTNLDEGACHVLLQLPRTKTNGDE
jgi:acetylcholinesterase